MTFSNTLLVTLLLCCFVLMCLAIDDKANSDQDSDTKVKEERESKEMEAFLKLMIKSSQKSFKRMLETIDIGSFTSSKCNTSWHRFMADNELSPEKFSTIMEDYKTGNHDKIIKLVRPEQCLISENGKFCQIDHVTNITMRSKPRVFDLTYAFCYPRGCSNDELNTILSVLTDHYKGMMIQVKMNIVKCITSMENVTKMEIDTAQKLMAKLSGANNQTFDSLSKPKLVDSFEPPMTSFSPLPSPSVTSVTSDQTYVSPSNLPNFSLDVDNTPILTLKDFGVHGPLLTTESPFISTSAQADIVKPSTLSTALPSLISLPTTTTTTTTTLKPITSSPSSINNPVYNKWPENDPDDSEDTSPLVYPDIYYSDDLSDPLKPVTSTSTANPSDINKQFDKTRLLRMIPGLIIQDDQD